MAKRINNPYLVKNIAPSALDAKKIQQQFKQLLKIGYSLHVAGLAKYLKPDYLVRTRPPLHHIELYGVQYFLTDIRRDIGFRYFVAYIVMPQHKDTPRSQRKKIYARIFYKDSSLIWRSASHLINTDGDLWVGKGDVKPVFEDGEIEYYSAEETTNLPFEIDAALDNISRKTKEVIQDKKAMSLVLHNAPEGRILPYADFSAPRKKAMNNPNFAINKNQKIAWFTNPTNPRSLKFAAGYQPDFRNGLIDTSESFSKIYHGAIKKYRIASLNREIQYLFIHAPKQVWIIPPQPIDNLLTSYGVRTVDADADDDLCLPGFEYHYLMDPSDPSSLYSQIPIGYAGKTSDVDPDRADASPWIEAMPVIKKFRDAIKKALI